MEDSSDTKRHKGKARRAKALLRAVRKSKHRHAAEKLVLSPFQLIKKQLKRLLKYYYRHQHELRAPTFLVLWFFWLLIGSFFYAYAPKSNLGIHKGFFQALNIGYSIGYGFPVEQNTNNYLLFSTWYVLVGASFVGAALGFFAEKISKDSETWFTRLEKQKRIENGLKARETYLVATVTAWLRYCSSALKALSVWLAFILAMITYSMVTIKWSFQEALYFAVSSLSTGGHWSIPNNSPDWLFSLTGLFLMFGVPVMAVAMAQFALLFFGHTDLDEAKATIDAVVTKEELMFLEELGLENFGGEIDKAEFIILCMVRMGNDPGLIKYITQRFAELNFYTGESLTVAEITQGACKFVDGRVRRSESVRGLGSTLLAVSEHQAVVPDSSFFDFVYSHDEGSSSDSCGAECNDVYPSTRSAPAMHNQSTQNKSRREYFFDEEPPAPDDELAEPASDKHDKGNGTNSAVDANSNKGAESSFLKRLVEKFGRINGESEKFSDTSDKCTSSSEGNGDADLTEAAEEGTMIWGSTSVQRLVQDLQQEECRAPESVAEYAGGNLAPSDARKGEH